MAAAASVLLVAAAGRWWPDDQNTSLAIAAAALVLAATATLWVGALFLALLGRGRFSPWMGIYPAMIFCTIVATVNARPVFDDYRPEFEEVAAQLLAEPGRNYMSDVQIGRFSLANIYDTNDGEVYFHDARRNLLPDSNPGWIYSPDRTPNGAERLGLENIGGGWYRFENVTVD